MNERHRIEPITATPSKVDRGMCAHCVGRIYQDEDRGWVHYLDHQPECTLVEEPEGLAQAEAPPRRRAAPMGDFSDHAFPLDSPRKDRHKGLDVMTMPVISTGHVAEGDAEFLDECVDRPVLRWHYGWIVYAAAEPDTWDDRLSPAFLECCAWARGLGYDWLRFDSDGERRDELRWHEW